MAGLIGGCGVALAVLQPNGPVEIAASMGVWIAAVRLPPAVAAVTAGAITAALAVAVGLTGHPGAQSAITATLLCLLLAVTGQFIRRGRESQDRTELLLAQLQDAREGEAAAAALAERSRIAGELHDVLAHSLSGLAIQLQGARKLAAREAVSESLRAAIERSAELTKAGSPTQGRPSAPCAATGCPPWISWRPWSRISAATPAPTPPCGSTGRAGSLPAEASLALFRGAQEALTNISRYAPGAATAVTVSYQADRTLVTVEDHVRAQPEAGPGPARRPGPGRPGRRGRRARPDGDARASPAGGRHRPGRADRRRMASRAGGAGVTSAPERGTIRVLIADDQRVVREGLSMLVALIDGVEVVGTACDGAEAVRLAEAHRPDVILMDLRMPGTDGIAATADLRERLPATRVLVLTTYADEDAILPALQAGRAGLPDQGRQRRADRGGDPRGARRADPSRPRRPGTPRGHGHRPAPAPARTGPARATARRAHRPRGRGAHPARLGPEQRRDRPAPVPQQRHGQDAHQPDLRQDRRPGPGPGRQVRLPARPGDPRSVTAITPGASAEQGRLHRGQPGRSSPVRISAPPTA